MAYFEEKFLESFEKKPMTWWRYTDDIFFLWEHGEEPLKVFIEQINMFHSTTKFTAEYSKEEVKGKWTLPGRALGHSVFCSVLCCLFCSVVSFITQFTILEEVFLISFLNFKSYCFSFYIGNLFYTIL